MPPRITAGAAASVRATSTANLVSAMSSLSMSARPLATSKSSIAAFLVPSLQRRNASILSSLSDTPGSYNRKKRRGRGPSSGLGKTSGRGHKGQKQHGKVPARFQGGQTPQWISHHQRGFENQYVLPQERPKRGARLVLTYLQAFPLRCRYLT